MLPCNDVFCFRLLVRSSVKSLLSLLSRLATYRITCTWLSLQIWNSLLYCKQFVYLFNIGGHKFPSWMVGQWCLAVSSSQCCSVFISLVSWSCRGRNYQPTHQMSITRKVFVYLREGGTPTLPELNPGDCWQQWDKRPQNCCHASILWSCPPSTYTNIHFPIYQYIRWDCGCRILFMLMASASKFPPSLPAYCFDLRNFGRKQCWLCRWCFVVRHSLMEVCSMLWICVRCLSTMPVPNDLKLLLWIERERDH